MAHHYTNDTRERSAHSVSSQRKRPRQQEPPSYNDILAFGYAALTFRNDELAGSIERGDYLIPWNGETEADTDDVIYLDST
ncbi:hypothetical protein BKA69DRAFT_496253 [Paraphysoderma sedebokerense]|nr:hypothetical protein BKA69DRAFT_496253 [Paraphysoderma sedebokerense]